MNFIANLDNYLIDKVMQPCVDFLVNRGKTKYLALDICLVSAFVAAVLMDDIGPKLKLSDFVLLGMCCLIFVFQNLRCKRIAKQDTNSLAMPRARIQFQSGRYFCLVWLFITFIILAGPDIILRVSVRELACDILSAASPFIGVALPFFVLACRDKPPYKKVKKTVLEVNPLQQTT